MKIDSIEIFQVKVPILAPFRTAFDNTTASEGILVRIESDGVVGWGEANPWNAPLYSGEWAAGAFGVARDWLAPRLLNQEISSGEELQKLLGVFKDNRFAKAAFDLAWWDLHARQKAQPLWKVLGGKSAQVESGADFGVAESIDELLADIAAAERDGYKRVKLKYRPGWEIEMMREVRAAFPDMVFHVDCNSAYTLDDLPMLEQLDQFDLAMIEQPLSHDDLIDHAKLQQKIKTPICLDESITSVAKARQAIEIGAGRWVNIKPGRVGGTTVAVAIHDLCAQNDVPCWIGGMLESSVGASHCVALATLPNIKYPSDIFPAHRFYARELGEPAMTHSSPAFFTASEEAGIGATPNAQMLEKCTVDRVSL